MKTTLHPGTRLPLPSRELIEELFTESETATDLIYCLPESLIRCLTSEKHDAAPPLLDQDSIARELRLAEFVHSFDQVAFRHDPTTQTVSVVSFRYLGDSPVPVTSEFMRLAGSKYPEAAAEEFNAVFEPHHLHVQGYCGWLLQQDEYWRDLKAIVGLFGNELTGTLLPQQVFSPPKDAKPVTEKRCIDGRL